MSKINTEQLVIVQNPQSTRAELFDERVAFPLHQAGIDFRIIPTESKDAEANIAALSEQLPDSGIVISAGGDGTASQVMNAVLRGKKRNKEGVAKVALGFVRLGNFNDIAGEHTGAQDVLTLLDAPIVNIRPMIVEVDGEYLCHAPGYFSLGGASLAARKFSEKGTRQEVRQTPEQLKLASSLGRVAAHYMQNRDQYLPAFRVNNGTRIVEKATDIIAINTPRVARVVRTQRPYYDSPEFGARTNIDTSRIVPNVPVGLRALAGKMPLVPVENMHITFAEDALVPAQAEGEFRLLKVKELSVHKRPEDVIRVLHAR